MAVVDELITLLGFETKAGTESKLKKFEAGIGKLVNVAKKAAFAIAGITTAVSAWNVAAAKSADDTLKFSRSLGISVEALQELEFAAERSGASVGSVRSMLEKAAQFGLTGAGAIEQLADQFVGLDAATALLRGQAYGFSEEDIRLLSKGSAGIRALREEARQLGFIISKEDALKAEQFVDALTNVRKAVVGLARQVAINALPATKELTDSFLEWFKLNRELIASGLADFVTGISDGMRRFIDIVQKVIDKFKTASGPLNDFFARLDKVQVISGIVTGGLTILAVLLAVIGAKFILAAAAIGAVTLAIEDFIVFLQGGNSAIGLFVSKIEDKFPGIVGLFRVLAKVVGGVLLVAFNALRDMVTDTINALSKMFGVFGKGLALVDKGLQKLGFGKNKNKVELNTEIQKQIANVQGNTVIAGQAVAPVTAPIPPAIAAQNNRTINQGDTTIIVNGAGDPRGVAEQVINRSGLQNAQQIVSPGIEAQVAQ